MKEISLFQKCLSWFFPINITKKSGSINPTIYLKLYQGQLILATPVAIYSYGTMYTPFRVMFKHLKNELPSIHNFLMLGTGLGSALSMLQKKYNCFPQTDLVDIDEAILKLSMEYMQLNSQHNVEWHADDAMSFIKRSQKKYDLIALDIFRDMETPKAFHEHHFYSLCLQHLNPKGILCLNTIPVNKDEEAQTLIQLSAMFSQVQPIPFGRNIFYICRK